MPHVVLASGSPRRRQLLAEMSIRFTVAPTDADETLPGGASPAEAAEQLARRKAHEAAALAPGALVIAADTLVAVGGHILGKPADERQAAQMLGMLQGRAHEVVTGLCVAWRGELTSACERTVVRFDEMTERDIQQYVATGDPMDKAGAYGIQGRAGEYISGIEGCYFNVMGLPKSALKKLLIRVLGAEGYRALASPAGCRDAQPGESPADPGRS